MILTPSPDVQRENTKQRRGSAPDKLGTRSGPADPCRVWVPPSPDPSSQCDSARAPRAPRGVPSEHAVSPGSGRSRAGKAAPGTSGCDQCSQSWLGSCPGCFPRDADPAAPRQGSAHPAPQMHRRAAPGPARAQGSDPAERQNNAGALLLRGSLPGAITAVAPRAQPSQPGQPPC